MTSVTQFWIRRSSWSPLIPQLVIHGRLIGSRQQTICSSFIHIVFEVCKKGCVTNCVVCNSIQQNKTGLKKVCTISHSQNCILRWYRASYLIHISVLYDSSTIQWHYFLSKLDSVHKKHSFPSTNQVILTDFEFFIKKKLINENCNCFGYLFCQQ